MDKLDIVITSAYFMCKFKRDRAQSLTNTKVIHKEITKKQSVVFFCKVLCLCLKVSRFLQVLIYFITDLAQCKMATVHLGVSDDSIEMTVSPRVTTAQNIPISVLFLRTQKSPGGLPF
uniref:Uncharacterized protein n=1 Tax=Anguilla anguilla TaxID=7936 RepID=A0A0E9X2P2_ANGAN